MSAMNNALASPAAPVLHAPDTHPRDTLCVVSLNVAQLAGRSGFIPLARFTAPRVAAHLGALLAAEGADVLALQECPPARGAHEPLAGVLSRLPGPAARVVRPDALEHGPALVTARPHTRSDARLFAPGHRDGKGFACAEIATHRAHVLVVSVHLAVLGRRARRAQIDRLAECLASYAGPRVVVGDLNDGGDGPRYLAARTGLVLHAPGPTFPAALPALRLDWVLTSESLRVERLTTLRHLPADHCGVRVELAHRDAA